MAIYKVMISGKCLKLSGEDGNFLNVGFVKNVYLYGKSKENACSSALSIVEQELVDQIDKGFIVTNKINIVIDEIESTYKIWKLFGKEGFIFFHDED